MCASWNNIARSQNAWTPYRHMSWSKYVAGKAQGPVINGPLCHAEHEHSLTLFSELMHIKHITESTYRHHNISPLIEGKTQHRSLCQDERRE